MDPVIIIGAGHNGLTAAFYLAKAGLTPIVLERRAVVGGAAITEEIAAGYRCPALAHAIGPLRPAIARDLQLERRGISFVRPDPRVVALSADGRALALSSDHGRAVEAIRTFSSSDADRYADFCATLERLGAFFAALADHAPPSLNPSSASEMWALLKTGRRFRALGRADSFRLLRWAPMAVADFVGEWFETELLQAVIASRGVFGTALGPRSAGSGAVLLNQAGVDAAPGGGSVMVTGGPGSLTSAMADAARDAGAEVQTGTTVARILARDGRVTGVVLGDGREIQARAVISNADPRSTLLNLVDPLDLDPGFLTKARNVRCPGTVAKVNLALAGAPAFTGVDAASVRGRVHIGPSIDYLERAFDASKYGQLPEEPYLDITIPTLHDPTLAPPGHHVMSIVAQFVPYKLADGQQWDTERDRLASIVIRTLDRYAPGIAGLVQSTQVFTPVDLEREYSLSGGHIFHGELSLGQLFTMRPILGWAQYRTPLAGLYLCGAGTHGAPGITGTQGRNAAREVVRDLKRGGPSGSTVR